MSRKLTTRKQLSIVTLKRAAKLANPTRGPPKVIKLGFAPRRHVGERVGCCQHRESATKAVPGDQQPCASGTGLGKSGLQTVANRQVDGLKSRMDVLEIR
jgi:hypothetical protein